METVLSSESACGVRRIDRDRKQRFRGHKADSKEIENTKLITKRTGVVSVTPVPPHTLCC